MVMKKYKKTRHLDFEIYLTKAEQNLVSHEDGLTIPLDDADLGTIKQSNTITLIIKDYDESHREIIGVAEIDKEKRE